MIYLLALIAALCFAVAFRGFGVAEAGFRIIDIARDAAKAIRAPGLEDVARERAVQRASLQMIVGFLSIVARTAAAFGVLLLSMSVFEWVGMAPRAAVTEFFATWQGIAWGAVIMTAAQLIRRQA